MRVIVLHLRVFHGGVVVFRLSAPARGVHLIQSITYPGPRYARSNRDINPIGLAEQAFELELLEAVRWRSLIRRC